MTDATWWEPPLAGSEPEQLLGALDRQRATFRWKADGLTTDALRLRWGASALTLGGLLKHLALVEDDCSRRRLDGSDLPAVWAGHDGSPDQEFTSAADDSAADLYRLYDDAVEGARDRWRRAVDERGLDSPAAAQDDDGRHASLRRVLLDLLEEYARHTGHADLLREQVDGRTGEDPPPGWRPTPG